MEKFALSTETLPALNEYLEGRLMAHERVIAESMLAAVNGGDVASCDWFSAMGDRIHVIVMNVHGYQKGLAFGFEGIALDKNGWLVRPVLLDIQVIDLGDTSRFGRYSSVAVGRGPNGVWTTGIRCSYGVAGESSWLSVFGKQFNSRDAALTDVLSDLKSRMLQKVGNTDTTNYHQDVIRKTLEAIAKYEVGRIQLALF